MSTWVLILIVMTSGQGIVTQEFASESACENALQRVLMVPTPAPRHVEIKGVCVPKQ